MNVMPGRLLCICDTDFHRLLTFVSLVTIGQVICREIKPSAGWHRDGIVRANGKPVTGCAYSPDEQQ